MSVNVGRLRSAIEVTDHPADIIPLSRAETVALIAVAEAAREGIDYAPNGDPDCAHSAGDGTTGLCVHCGFNPALDRLRDALAALDFEAGP